MTEEKYEYEMFYTIENHKSRALCDVNLTEDQMKEVFNTFLNHPDCYNIHIHKEDFVHDTKRKNDG